MRRRHITRRIFKGLALTLGLLLVAAAALVSWTVVRAWPQRDGTLPLAGLSAPVQVDYDERGVPHLQAQNEADLYRALGFVHAQDRLFQMELMRRLAQGELAEVLGPKLIETDTLFRTLGIRRKAADVASRLDPQDASTAALRAYLDGINQFQRTRPLPPEFHLLGIPPRPFTLQDTVAVGGYLAYSFAAAFRTEPVLTFVRDQLGPAHLRIFEGGDTVPPPPPLALGKGSWQALGRLAEISQGVTELTGLPQLEGSNAWAISGTRTASGRPLLAGDPHITFALPSVWYEAHLRAPGFELYGHHQALVPFALLGHNQAFGWSLTMFQNDDLDLVALKTHPQDPKQVWHHGRWVALEERTETLRVKGAAPVTLRLQDSPYGPVVTGPFQNALAGRPVAMWWAFLETDNPLLEAFYQLNRADSLAKARQAASGIHAPGLNIVWANQGGDMAWWAAARLPRRPPGVDPRFILDAGRGEAEKPGFLPFASNPHEENPARAYIVSANQAPAAPAPAGYYNLGERARRLETALMAQPQGWTVAQSQALQLDTGTAYGPRLLAQMLPELSSDMDARSQALRRQLAAWDGRYTPDSTSATVFNQWLYETARATFEDELPAPLLDNLLKTRAIDHALPRLLADPHSPWWDDRRTAAVEDRQATLQVAWRATLTHLEGLWGGDPAAWTWSRASTVTHGHPLGKLEPLNLLLDVGPFPAPGGREVPSNFAAPMGPAPWKVQYGPSTRRVIDFAQPGQAQGINPVGQSGLPLDRHYRDQALAYHQGHSATQHLLDADVQAHRQSTLRLAPGR